jgi:mono/diheme cytochrome c family protein
MRRIAIGLLLMFAAPSVRAETLVERGSYLAGTVMTCHNCHTPRGPNGFDFSQALSGGQAFDEPPFKVTASNITPDRETGIGTWSDAQLRKFLVTGIRPDGTSVAPIMPTGFYPVMTPRDLDALVAYLRSVPAVHRQMPAPEYRIKLPRETPPFTTSQATEAEMVDPLKRGRYLVTIAHCLECHTPRGPAGHDFDSSTGKGGWVFNGPGGDVVSANITSHPTAGLGQWTDDEIRRAMTEGISRDGHKLKPPMGYGFYAKMTRQDQDAIIAFVRTLPPRS